MARAEPFPATAMQDIIADVGDWLSASELPTADARIASAPLSVWDVQPGVSLREAATPSGEWHHQIARAGRAFAFARSRLVGERGNIIELSESPLTEALEAALGTLRTIADDSLVLRILRSQRHHTTCLWLHKANGTTDDVVVLQSPVLATGLRVDESTFLRMVEALPGPGLTVRHRDPRRLDVHHWGRNWKDIRTQPVRHVGEP
jgi:hypothetical protein